MKSNLRLLVSGIIFLMLVSTVWAQVPTTQSYEDGTYRGVYGEAENQVTLELTLKSNMVTRIAFRNLVYGGINFRSSTDETVIAVKRQYEALINYLVGKDIRTALPALYKPGDLVRNPAPAKQGNPIRNVDAFSGATLRSPKIISATRDALNRGVYSY